MYMVIRIEEQLKGKQKVLFDNGVSCSLYRAERKQFDIREGQCLQEEAYGRLMELLAERAVKRALHLLEQTDRTEKQLREKLALSDYPSCCIEEAVSRMKEYRYLDDYRYACHYICCAEEKESRRRMGQKLMQRGISQDVIEQALEANCSACEQDKIRELLFKRRFDPEQADEKEFQRTYRFLLGRGFQSRDILAATRYSGAF